MSWNLREILEPEATREASDTCVQRTMSRDPNRFPSWPPPATSSGDLSAVFSVFLSRSKHIQRAVRPPYSNKYTPAFATVADDRLGPRKLTTIALAHTSDSSLHTKGLLCHLSQAI